MPNSEGTETRLRALSAIAAAYHHLHSHFLLVRYNICMVQTEPLSSYKRYLVMYMKFRGDPSHQIRNPQQQQREQEKEQRYEVSNEPLVLCDEAKTD